MTRASLPPDGYRRPTSLRVVGDEVVVNVRADETGRSRSFRFSHLGLSASMVMALAEGFSRATGVGGTRRTLRSAETLHRDLRSYMILLASLPSTPDTVQELRPAHIEQLRLAGTTSGRDIISALRLVMRGHPDVPGDYVAALMKPIRARAAERVEAYSPAEFRALRRAMRTIVRKALARVRRMENELEAACADSTFRGSRRELILRELARTGDVPRRPSGGPLYREGIPIAKDLYPSLQEVTAAAVLMQCMSGQNIGTLLSLTTTHHRADDQRDETPMIQSRTRKPRRDRHRVEQDTNYSSEPVWLEEDDEESTLDVDVERQMDHRDDFNSAAGVYRIALELCARARQTADSVQLFCAYSPTRRPAESNGSWCREVHSFKSSNRNVLWEFRGKMIQGVDSPRVRRAFLNQHRRPVDHTVTTMTDDYLIRDRAVRRESQTVVASALAEEESRLRAASAVIVLGPRDLEKIQTDPRLAADGLGIPAATLTAAVEGELDTVATGCISNLESPYSRPGLPCTASFLLCLGCPNALAEPRHVPVLAAVSIELAAKRSQMQADAWDQAFGLAYARASDLLERLRDAGAPDAPATPHPHIVDLVRMLVDGKLELR